MCTEIVYCACGKLWQICTEIVYCAGGNFGRCVLKHCILRVLRFDR
jgi:hypothetical protein